MTSTLAEWADKNAEWSIVDGRKRTFPGIVSDALKAGAKPVDICRNVGCTRFTLDRWAKGYSEPAPASKPWIEREIRRLEMKAWLNGPGRLPGRYAKGFTLGIAHLCGHQTEPTKPADVLTMELP